LGAEQLYIGAGHGLLRGSVDDAASDLAIFYGPKGGVAEKRQGGGNE
jgi:hypothetical protein